MFHLVTYDIAKDRKRKKMSDFLLEYGVRVQYSVFECDLTEKDVKAIMEKAEELIDLATDSVLMYPLCKNCVGKRIRIGTTYTLVKVKKDLLDLM